MTSVTITSDAEQTRLPVHVRFRDIREANIAQNWPALLRLIKDEGFPEGVWLGRNTRAWPLPAILKWLEGRPSALKVVKVSSRKKLQQQDQQTETPAG
jgi:hypothetical protein